LTAVRWVPVARAARSNELHRGLEVPVVQHRVVCEGMTTMFRKEPGL
jgi:hypothetical protein